MKKDHIYLILMVVFLLLGSCMIKTDRGETQIDIDEAVSEAEEEAMEAADILAQTAGRETESKSQIRTIDEAIARADRRFQEVTELIAESQPTDPAVYVLGIENKTARCLSGETKWWLLASAEPDE